jgi:hypothetical protein
MTMRRAVIGWFLFALVCAQSIGLLHRATHLPTGAAAVLSSPVTDAAQPVDQVHAANWLHALFAHQDDSGCRLFDGVGQCGTPPHASDPVTALPPAAPLPTWAQVSLHERQTAPYLARAPPDSH